MLRIVCALVLAACSIFGQTAYTFRKVIDSRSPGWPFQGASRLHFLFVGGPVINDQGAVAFVAWTDPAGYYVSPDGVISKMGQMGLIWSLNNSGTVLYSSNLGGGLYTWSEGTHRTVLAGSYSGATMTDLGIVYFTTNANYPFNFLDLPGGGLFGWDGTNTWRIVSEENMSTRAPYSRYFWRGVAANRIGELAFVSGQDADCADCLFKKSGGPLMQLSAEPGMSGTPAINAAGDVAYQSSTGFFVVSGGTKRTLVDFANSPLTQNGDASFLEDRAVSFNDRGEIAFLTKDRRPALVRGIFTGPDPVRDRVIAVGDPLFGETVLELEADGLSAGRRINNKGEIVFEYRLTNGVAGVAIATPRAPGTPMIRGIDAEFMGKAGASAGMYLQVKGINLSSTTRTWASTDFKGSIAPTVLDGTRATVGGKPAVVEYVSPTQVNIIVPEDAVTGRVDVQIATSAGVSDALPVKRGNVSPALLTTPAFLISGAQHVVAQTIDFSSYIGPPGMVPGVAMRRAKPGETVTIFALGLGPTAPETSSTSIAAQNAPITSNFQVRIASRPAQVQFAGVVAGSIGLYQLNVVIPDLPPNNWPLDVTVDGVSNAQNLVIAVGP